MARSKVHSCARHHGDACPHCVHKKLLALQPGEELIVLPGHYTEPVTLRGLRGTPGKPIRISGKVCFDAATFDPAIEQPAPEPVQHAVFGSNTEAADYRFEANRIAQRKQMAGESPGLYFIADEATMLLKDCQHVRISNLYFDRCWPTAIYLDNCQDVSIESCHFRWGTYAIGACGRDTRHLTVSRCRWRQNPDNSGHWKSVTWKSIHGHLDDDPVGGAVDVQNDNRHFDGDFFVAWRIAGFVSIKDCVIEDAFNAIHMFGEEGARMQSRVNLNVVIERNTFRRIRDNAVEPEVGAWNWVVRHNVFVDVYRWFSFEMERSGWFYIYGNLGWHTGFPGSEHEDKTAGSLFKLAADHIADGPMHVFHNSWHLRETIAAKGRLAGLRFENNAIAWCQDPEGGKCAPDKPVIFGKKVEKLAPGSAADDDAVAKSDEQGRFTKLWRRLEIVFNGNVCGMGPSLQELIDAGYSVGRNAMRTEPDFGGPLDCPEGFKAKQGGGNLAGAPSFSIHLHFEKRLEIDGPRFVGAWQPDGQLFELPVEFGWIDPGR